MWALVNKTPFAAMPGWVRDKDGAEVWLVAVRATFDILPDSNLRRAESQEPVCMAPKHRGEPPTSSLLYDSDLLPTKQTTDVLLHGHAYAPQGRPAPQVDVMIKVGPISKALKIFGDRYWRVGMLGLNLSDPDPFVKMPLTYERAYGGYDPASVLLEKPVWDVRNPVGVGFVTDADHLAGRKAPNIEDPRHPITSWKDRPAPAGFGPIAGHWQPRVKFGGTYDEKWEKERQPLLPADFDDRFYQSAPEDQRPVRPLRGGEAVELFNLTPAGFLKFTLPRLAFAFESQFNDGVEHHHASLQTVILEPDSPRVTLVWLSALPCHPRVVKLKQTTVREKDYVGDLGDVAGTKEVPAS